MKLSTQGYKGTRDLYPEDEQLQNLIFSNWHRTSQQFGFLEYGAPLLEPLEIYQAKSGDELANQQTYAFTDRGERQVAIRPEMTPSICRLVAAKRQNWLIRLVFTQLLTLCAMNAPKKVASVNFGS